MGKRKAIFTGLSRFLPEAAEPQPQPASLSSTPVASASSSTVVEESLAVSEEGRASKKRKTNGTGLLGPGLEKYDATGLVPFYTEPSQVPAHLQKCACSVTSYFFSG